MTKPRHPGRTPAQRRALDAIGCGNSSPIMARSTRDAMLDAGLIVKVGERIYDSWLLAVRIAEYEMPTPVHMQWCEFCAATVPEEP